jgi:hypothetical protein
MELFKVVDTQTRICIGIAALAMTLSLLVSEEHDYILRISQNVIVILMPMLVLFGTMSTNLIREMLDFKNNYPDILNDGKTMINYDDLIDEIRTCFVNEFYCIALSVFLLILRCIVVSNQFSNVLLILSRAAVDFVTVFSIAYFLDVVRQTILALFDLYKQKNEASFLLGKKNRRN